jgi:hypothetical protein
MPEPQGHNDDWCIWVSFYHGGSGEHHGRPRRSFGTVFTRTTVHIRFPGFLRWRRQSLPSLHVQTMTRVPLIAGTNSLSVLCCECVVRLCLNVMTDGRRGSFWACRATKKEYFWEDAEAQRTQRNQVAVCITGLWQLSRLSERTIESRPEQKVEKIYSDSDKSRKFLYCPRVGYSGGNLCHPARKPTHGFHFIPSCSSSTRASRATTPVLSFS